MTFLINHFQGTTDASLRATYEQQGANGVDGSALATNDFAHVCGVHAEFVNGKAVTIRRCDGDRIRAIDQPLNHVIEKGFHR